VPGGKPLLDGAALVGVAVNRADRVLHHLERDRAEEALRRCGRRRCHLLSLLLIERWLLLYPGIVNQIFEISNQKIVERHSSQVDRLNPANLSPFAATPGKCTPLIKLP
jgi:hypothetical protein